MKQESKDASWLIGEGLLGPNVNGDALRSMKAPGMAYDDSILGKDPQPYHMRDFANITYDKGGVHINSGIPNHAFYLASMFMGGKSWEKLGKIWYESLQRNHNTLINFVQWADLTIDVAGDYFGNNSMEQKCIKRAWHLVGVN